MSHFLWYNPIISHLYNEQSLLKVLVAKGFIPVKCENDHLNIVAEKYRNALQQAKKCVVDMRCPQAVSYIKRYWDVTHFEFPDIEPILIHCTLELKEKYTYAQNKLWIITPCQSLKDLGTDLQLKNTTFQTWKAFSSEHQINLAKKKLTHSPIPPGFFSEYGKQAAILSSKAAIDAFFAQKNYQEKIIAEMLFCDGGCHRGDGV